LGNILDDCLQISLVTLVPTVFFQAEKLMAVGELHPTVVKVGVAGTLLSDERKFF
jgi:hypothetical protein